MRKNVWCLSWAPVPSLSIIHSSSNHLPEDFMIFFLYSWSEFQCACALYFHYSFIMWRAFSLFLFPGCCEQSSSQYGRASIWGGGCLLVGAAHLVDLFLAFWEFSSFPEWLGQFAVPPAVNEVSPILPTFFFSCFYILAVLTAVS